MIKIFLTILGYLSAAGVAQGVTFPSGKFVTAQKNFWVDAFSRYDRHQVMIHDRDYTYLVLDVIDLDITEKTFKRSLSRREKKKVVDRYLARYQKAIQNFGRYKQKARNLGYIEKRVWSVYSKDQDALSKLLAGKSKLRLQYGLRSGFREAVKRSGTYLYSMQSILSSQGVPPDLVNLVFVESLFKPQAISPVGAAGVWQLMPPIASPYLRMDKAVDERRSPIKATRVAALILKENKDNLKIWPYAITAYNHGPSGVRRIQKQYGTKGFDMGLKRYRGKNFGFFSRNFYAEFLAAREVMAKYKPHAPTVRLTSVRTKEPVNLKKLATRYPLNILKAYNPCLSPAAVARYQKTNLPVGYELIVPTKQQLIADRGE